MFLKKILVVPLIASAGFLPGLAQQVITSDELVSMALRESPLRKAAALQTQRRQALVGQSVMLPDPELIIESPTGDFYVAGVEQTFEFPTVYARQKQMARQQIAAARNEETATDLQIRLHIREHYLEWQYALAWEHYSQTRDSVYQLIRELSDRQFAAGQIDAVERTLAHVKYTEVHSLLLQARNEVHIVRTRLEPFAAGLENRIPIPLEEHMFATDDLRTDNTDSSFLAGNWMLDPYKTAKVLAGKEVQLEKARRLPDFRVGYLNQGMRHNPFQMGLRLGISIPLPTGAYRASIESAKLELERLDQQELQATQDIRTEWHQARQKLIQYEQTLEWLSNQGEPATVELISTAQRMYEAGQYDLIRLLTIMAESFTLHEMYLENLMEYHRAALQLQYLNGIL